MGGGDAVGAVRDVRERTTVNERGNAFRRLHEIRFDRLGEECGHGAHGLDVLCRHGRAVASIAHDDPAETCLEIRNAVREAQHGHHLARRRDVEPGLARNAFATSAEPDDDVAQGAIVHVHDALPGHVPRIESGGAAIVEAVVHQRGEQVVRTRHGMKVAVEVHVDVHHRHDFRSAAARPAALHAEHGAEARLTQRGRASHTDLGQTLHQADGGRGLALSGGRGGDRRDEHELAASGEIPERFQGQLGLVVAVGFQIGWLDA